MAHLYLKLTIPTVALFTAMMFFIQAQPYDEQRLSALLIPDDCETPCFLGIRPGVTRVDEAIEILRSHAWVGDIEPHAIGPGTSYIHLRGWVFWDWKADAPVWFRGVSPMVGTHAGAFNTLDGVVEDITVATNVPFGRMWLALGKPTEYQLGFSLIVTRKGGVTMAVLRYQNGTLQNDVELSGVTLCQNAWNIWFQPSLITILNDDQPKGDVRFIANRPVLFVAHSLQNRVCAGR